MGKSLKEMLRRKLSSTHKQKRDDSGLLKRSSREETGCLYDPNSLYYQELRGMPDHNIFDCALVGSDKKKDIYRMTRINDGGDEDNDNAFQKFIFYRDREKTSVKSICLLNLDTLYQINFKFDNQGTLKRRRSFNAILAHG
jgi:hypothetical protein